MSSINSKSRKTIGELREDDVVGIDFGGVIAGGKAIGGGTLEDRNEDTKGFFGENYLNVPAIDGAFEMVKRIVVRVGPENVFIISKAGEKTEEKSREWLKIHDFYSLTGMLPENVRFCTERPQKLAIGGEIGLTLFIDDAYENVQRMTQLRKCRGTFLFGEQRKQVKGWTEPVDAGLPTRIFSGTVCMHAKSWSDVESVLFAGEESEDESEAPHPPQEAPQPPQEASSPRQEVATQEVAAQGLGQWLMNVIMLSRSPFF